MSKITMIFGDCMKYMAGLDEDTFDLAIVDPPYGIGADNFSNGENKNRNDGFNRGESSAKRIKNRLNRGGGKLKNRLLNNSNCSWDEAPSSEYFTVLFKISNNQIIWGGNYFNLPPSRGFVCWDKCQPWENFSQFELAWTSFDKPAAMFKYSNTGGANRERKIHPTQKPVALYKWLLQKYSKDSPTILDTHGGSGSIAIACISSGFDLVWIEKCEDYYRSAVDRVRRYNAQLDMFRNQAEIVEVAQ